MKIYLKNDVYDYVMKVKLKKHHDYDHQDLPVMPVEQDGSMSPEPLGVPSAGSKAMPRNKLKEYMRNSSGLLWRRKTMRPERQKERRCRFCRPRRR
jgi:hypothetical protein